ncbi:MAG TPA: A/G-specific adenine glycosylase, partial [Verrucomicrobiae bacterium]|nr:A/G-specific adenine glycosylase [Verrucomicrobiae bacterium]
MIDDAAKQLFRETVWEYYRAHGRHDLPWRQRFDPYAVTVSELMLQQTQVRRVIPKYEEFLEKFPDVQSLAATPSGDVLRAWSGLGYNRRAQFLWQAAR